MQAPVPSAMFTSAVFRISAHVKKARDPKDEAANNNQAFGAFEARIQLCFSPLLARKCFPLPCDLYNDWRLKTLVSRQASSPAMTFRPLNASARMRSMQINTPIPSGLIQVMQIRLNGCPSALLFFRLYSLIISPFSSSRSPTNINHRKKVEGWNWGWWSWSYWCC